MNAVTDARHLELNVSNFGPISEASIDLRPMSVFVGPSNTGKSYMAILIYSLHQFFNAYSNMVHRTISATGRPLGVRMTIPAQSMDLSESDIAGLYDWASEVLQDPESRAHREFPPKDPPDTVAALVYRALNRVGHLNETLNDEIVRCFGVDDAMSLVRHPSRGKAGFSIRGYRPDESSRGVSFEYEAEVTKEGVKLDASIPGNMPIQFGQDFRSFPYFWTGVDEVDEIRKHFAPRLVGDVVGAAVSDIVDPLSRPAHYLPADRAGVMHAHQVAVRGLIASASRVALRPDSPMPVLSGVLGDFLEELVALAGLPRRRMRTEGSDLAQRLEHALMRGTVNIEPSQIDYPAFVYRPEGWKRDLPLMNASSMVSELAPVVLYLRHVVRPGDLLIIEEPESHLHPEMQVKFIRQLAAAAQSGIRIVITTHSEWVLEELANLVRLSELPPECREGIEDADVALSPDQVGAWFFEPDSDRLGSVVREIPLDTESATFPSGFGLVTESLYNRWVEISNRIQEE